MSDRFVALYALPLGRGRGFLRIIGDTNVARLPFRPFWLEPMRFEDWADNPTKPETEKLCREFGVDVLFLVHVERSPRGRLLRMKLEGKDSL